MIWKWESCEGTIALADEGNRSSIGIRFGVECKMDGKIDLQVQPVNWSTETNRIFDAFNRSGAYLIRLLLSGKSSDGVILSSDKVYMVGSGLNAKKGESTTLQISIECTELLASDPNFDCITMYTSQGLLRYDLIGFRCFKTIRKAADVGEIRAAGATEIEDYNKDNWRDHC